MDGSVFFWFFFLALTHSFVLIYSFEQTNADAVSLLHLAQTLPLVNIISGRGR